VRPAGPPPRGLTPALDAVETPKTVAPLAWGMRPSGVALAATLAAAVLLVPAATATDAHATLTFASGFASATFHVEMTLDGEGAQNFRQGMDSTYTGGNGDGQVSQSEVDAFLAIAKDSVEGGAKSGLANDNTTFDGKPLQGFTFGGLTADGAVGPVASTSPITLNVDGTLGLQPGAGPEHTFFSKGSGGSSSGSTTSSSPDEPDFQVQVTAPAGFVISKADGLPGSSLSDDHATLSFSAKGAGEQDSTIVFSPASSSEASGNGSKSSPAAGPLLALGLACVAAAMRRRA